MPEAPQDAHEKYGVAEFTTEDPLAPLYKLVVACVDDLTGQTVAPAPDIVKAASDTLRALASMPLPSVGDEMREALTRAGGIDHEATIKSLIDRLAALQDAVLNGTRETSVELATKQLSQSWWVRLTQSAAPRPEREGPAPIVSTTLHCQGCKHLRTEWWKDHLDNDETDSGTSARCAAKPTEHGGESITAYWSPSCPVPSWCPLATGEGGDHLALAAIPDAPTQGEGM